MYLLIIVIYLLSGPPEVRTSIVEGPTAYDSCADALPLEIRLYKQGKFADGPPVAKIKNVKGHCEGLLDEVRVVKK